MESLHPRQPPNSSQSDMKYEYEKKRIQQIAAEHRYTATNVEKVIRLCHILQDLNSYEEFAGKLLLKGGTAINLIAFEKLPRLSVDLDLDFAFNLSKEETNRERENISEALSLYARDMGYEISDRGNYALDSKSLLYTTTTGSLDKIKLDINYHSRCHVYPATYSDIAFPFAYADHHIRVAHLDIIELFAGKIKALYERCKPRDIFDIFSLAKSGLLTSKDERDALRKCVVFYSVLGNADKPDLLSQDLGKMREMPFLTLKTQLLPMLHTKLGHFDKNNLFDVAVNYLESLMVLEESEKEFINKFFAGDFSPELLFDDSVANGLKQHPVVARTLQTMS